MVVNAELLKYIKDSLAIKVPIEQIKKNLIGAGWPNSLIDEAVNSLNQPVKVQEKMSNKLPFTRPESETKPKKRHAPAGIIILSVFGFIGVALNLLFGLALIFLAGTIDELLSSISPAFSSIGQVSMIIGISLIISDILGFFIILGLLKRKNLARAIMIIFSIIGIFGMLAVILLVGSSYYISEGVSIAIFLITAIYLLFSRKVKDFFNKK